MIDRRAGLRKKEGGLQKDGRFSICDMLNTGWDMRERLSTLMLVALGARRGGQTRNSSYVRKQFMLVQGCAGIVADLEGIHTC